MPEIIFFRDAQSEGPYSVAALAAAAGQRSRDQGEGPDQLLE